MSTERSADSQLVLQEGWGQDRNGPVLLTVDRREESLQGKQTRGLICSEGRWFGVSTRLTDESMSAVLPNREAHWLRSRAGKCVVFRHETTLMDQNSSHLVGLEVLPALGGT